MGVTLQPWRPGFPLRQASVIITDWHLHRQQTPGVKHLVLRDDIVDEEQVLADAISRVGSPNRYLTVTVKQSVRNSLVGAVRLSTSRNMTSNCVPSAMVAAAKSM